MSGLAGTTREVSPARAFRVVPGRPLTEREHWGHGYLNPDALAVSQLGAGAPQSSASWLSGRAAVDVTASTHAVDGRPDRELGPGRPFPSPEQLIESERIRFAIYDARREMAAREADLARADEDVD